MRDKRNAPNSGTHPEPVSNVEAGAQIGWREREANHEYPMRLQRFLARAGVASRRGSEKLMTAGRVEVNGIVVTELGTKVDPLVDEVSVDGVKVEWGAAPVTLALNKPAGIITTMDDFRGRRCVADLVPSDRYPGLYPIGRLDRDTTGLLLFSTDGELGNNLLHPSRHVTKVYRAVVEGAPTDEEVERLCRGVMLRDGMTAPAKVSVTDVQRGRAVLSIAIHEGRNHQVKRMCKAVGHPVVHLHRETFGPISLNGLPEGRWRVLEGGQLASLYRVAEEAARTAREERERTESQAGVDAEGTSHNPR